MKKVAKKIIGLLINLKWSETNLASNPSFATFCVTLSQLFNHPEIQYSYL